MSESRSLPFEILDLNWKGTRTDVSVTDFHKHHPGGSTVIVANAGRDVTYVPFLLILLTPLPIPFSEAEGTR
jgi:hypothetical protein